MSTDKKRKRPQPKMETVVETEAVSVPKPAPTPSAPAGVRSAPRMRTKRSVGLLTFGVYARTLPKKLDAYAAFHSWYVKLLLPAKLTREEWGAKLSEFNARTVGQ